MKCIAKSFMLSSVLPHLASFCKTLQVLNKTVLVAASKGLESDLVQICNVFVKYEGFPGELHLKFLL